MNAAMSRFVVGLDGSAAAASAMRWAGKLAASSGIEILAVNAYRHGFAEVRPETADRLISERESMLNSWIRPALDEGASVQAVLKQGDPRDVLLKVAEEVDAGLVVLGRTGQSGGPGFLHLGSVVEYAAHHARQPLAIIPSAVLGPIRRIIVGVDGSSESLGALRWCADLAQLNDASLRVVTVRDRNDEDTDSSPRSWRDDVEPQVRAWIAPLADMGISTDHVMQSDLHPADGLLGVASASDGDVLVIGTRGTGRVSGVRVGGVAMKVLHRAFLPLVLVPPVSEA
ncbi:MAG: universal stress protein [Acidimicrobiia bacterium]|nr:universal stress protein [Acidimicrobiia bacterium]